MVERNALALPDCHVKVTPSMSVPTTRTGRMQGEEKAPAVGMRTGHFLSE